MRMRRQLQAIRPPLGVATGDCAGRQLNQRTCGATLSLEVAQIGGPAIGFYAAALLDAGESISALASYLGHADPGFTLRVYTHLMPASEERTRRAIDDPLPRACRPHPAREPSRPPSKNAYDPAAPVGGLVRTLSRRIGDELPRFPTLAESLDAAFAGPLVRRALDRLTAGQSLVFGAVTVAPSAAGRVGVRVGALTRASATGALSPRCARTRA
ncbi:hypothetical protein GCM10027605_53340 [Micromonospora zhanjiangensis]